MGNQCCSEAPRGDPKNEQLKANIPNLDDDKEQKEAAKVIQNRWREKKGKQNQMTSENPDSRNRSQPNYQVSAQDNAYNFISSYPELNDKLKSLMNKNKDLVEIDWSKKGISRPSESQLKILEFDSGEIYRGELKNGSRNGFGENLWGYQKTYYIGQWRDGKSHGFGILVNTETEDIYQGEWVEGRVQGSGIHRSKDGFEYSGSWVDDQKAGHGTEAGKEYKYEGEFSQGQINGRGRLELFNKLVYEGELVDAKFNGKGKCVWNKGGAYDGDWQNGEMHGFGEFVWEDGSKYRGEYVHNKKNGKGEFLWKDKKKLVGSWVNGMKHGDFEFTNEKGETHKVKYENGKRLKQ